MSKEALVLSKEESQLLQTIQTEGTKCVNTNEQIEVLIQALLKAGSGTFNQVMDVVQKDIKLSEAIAKRLGSVNESIIASNNELTKMEIATYQGNIDAVKKFLENPTDPSVTAKDCFEEMRYYAQEIKEAREKDRQDKDMAYNRAKEANDRTLRKSDTGKGAIVFKAITELAAPVAELVFYFISSKDR